MRSIPEDTVRRIVAAFSDPKTPLDVATALELNPQTVKTVLKRAVTVGLVQRGPDRPTGGRGRPAYTYVAVPNPKLPERPVESA